MVLHDDLVVTTLVIKSEVVTKQGASLDLGCLKAKEVHFLIVLDLDLLIVCQALVLENVQCLTRRHWELHLIDANRRRRLLRIRVVHRRIDVLDAVLASWVAILRACMLARLLRNLCLELLPQRRQLL